MHGLPPNFHQLIKPMFPKLYTRPMRLIEIQSAFGVIWYRVVKHLIGQSLTFGPIWMVGDFWRKRGHLNFAHVVFPHRAPHVELTLLQTHFTHISSEEILVAVHLAVVDHRSYAFVSFAASSLPSRKMVRAMTSLSVAIPFVWRCFLKTKAQG